MNVSWHEVLPSIGDFINKTGFPVGLWLITGWIAYKLSKKIFEKLEPIIVAHFELVTQLKDTSSKTTEILEKQNEILVSNFTRHADILNDHGGKLDKIMKINLVRNEMLEDTNIAKQGVIPMVSTITPSTIGVSNGIKR